MIKNINIRERKGRIEQYCTGSRSREISVANFAMLECRIGLLSICIKEDVITDS